MRVEPDLVKGNVSRTLSDGTKVTRVYMVSEIEGNRSDIIFNATGAVPQPGDVHPTIPRIRVESVTANPVDSNTVEVTVVYATLKIGDSQVNEDAETQITIGGSVQSVLTNQFFEGRNKKLMVLKYTFPPDEDPEGTATEKEIVPTANREQAIITATLSRLEDEDPLNKAIEFVEHTNSRTFLGTRPRTWLCTSINGVSNDSGETFQVTYVFEFREETWDAVLAFTDKETGAIPSDVDTQADAQRPFQLQPTADFGQLDIEAFQS